MSQVALCEINDLGIFYRCYTQITQTYPSPEMQVVKDVKAGKDPIAACLEVMDKAKFVSNNNSQINGSMSAVDTDMATNVVNTMHRLHYSWFGIRDYKEYIGHWFRNLSNIYDASSPALYMTKALFDQNYSYADAFSGNITLQSIRETQPTLSPRGKAGRYDKKDRYGLSSWVLKDVNFSMMGRLKGVATMPVNQMVKFSGDTTGATGTILLNRHYGGGMLGSTPYVILASHYNVSPPRYDGGLRVNRGWSRAVYKEVLCRDFPVVREKDGSPFVVANSSIPFRRASGCVKCHTSMDRLAGVVRKFQFGLLRDANGRISNTSDTGHIILMGEHPTNVASATDFPSASDTNFYRRPAEGTLYYRSHNGTLVNQKLSGMQSLGEELAKQDDMYVCLAKRYYKYFTGIDVDTGDIQDPDHPALSEGDKTFRDIVIGLGQKMKIHKNPRLLIEDILNRPEYRTADFGLGSPTR